MNRYKNDNISDSISGQKLERNPTEAKKCHSKTKILHQRRNYANET